MMCNADFVFIDTEFSPVSHQWLSLGATIGDELFYAHTSDSLVLALAEVEFAGNRIRERVLGQLKKSAIPPGPLDDSTEMARAFCGWVARVGPRTLHICYDFSLDMELLEKAMQSAGLPWPANWMPCNLAILNEDAVADSARARAWARFATRHGVGQHHALADAAALQAAYLAQSASTP